MITIKKGKAEHIKPLLMLIKELAVWEKAGKEVTVTEEKLFKDGFGDNPRFSFLVAELDCEICGIALFYPKYSTWKGPCIFLEDIVVKENKRGLGIGTALFKAVVEIAKVENAARLEWQVLNWNETAISFYKKMNTSFDNEWINCRLSSEQIQSFKG